MSTFYALIGKNDRRVWRRGPIHQVHIYVKQEEAEKAMDAIKDHVNGDVRVVAVEISLDEAATKMIELKQ